MTETQEHWDCGAYGPEGREFGVRCFFAEAGERVCASQDECRDAMAAERQRVFHRIQELAAAGDPVGVDLAEAFTDPSQILGGGQGEDGSDDSRH